MFQVGGPEFLVIVIVALIAVGPDQLPGVVRKLGRWASQFRSMTSGLRNEFMAGIDEIEASVREPMEELSATFKEPTAELQRAIEDPDGAESGSDAAEREPADEPVRAPFTQPSTTAPLGLSTPVSEAEPEADPATDGIEDEAELDEPAGDDGSEPSDDTPADPEATA